MITQTTRRRLVIGGAAFTAAALALSSCGRSEDSPNSAPQATTSVSEGPATGNLTVWAMGAAAELGIGDWPESDEQWRELGDRSRLVSSRLEWNGSTLELTLPMPSAVLLEIQPDRD